ncbi:MAG: hypothetical protein ACR2P9_04300 [Gammaproteobacteria bacterium]
MNEQANITNHDSLGKSSTDISKAKEDEIQISKSVRWLAIGVMAALWVMTITLLVLSYWPK